MIIRTAVGQDWPRIYPFFSLIVAAGRTYAFPAGLSLEDARPWWMEEPPGRTVVALDGDTVLGSAKMAPNRPGRGSHVATASFMVDPDHQGQGVGRALGGHVLDWARSGGYHSIQLNAASRPTTRLCISGSCWASRFSPPSQKPSTTPRTGWWVCT